MYPEAFLRSDEQAVPAQSDPNFYFGSKQHRRAKAYLDYGVLRNEGFIVITGEIGAGNPPPAAGPWTASIAATS